MKLEKYDAKRVDKSTSHYPTPLQYDYQNSFYRVDKLKLSDKQSLRGGVVT